MCSLFSPWCSGAWQLFVVFLVDVGCIPIGKPIALSPYYLLRSNLHLLVSSPIGFLVEKMFLRSLNHVKSKFLLCETIWLWTWGIHNPDYHEYLQWLNNRILVAKWRYPFFQTRPAVLWLLFSSIAMYGWSVLSIIFNYLFNHMFAPINWLVSPVFTLFLPPFSFTGLVAMFSLTRGKDHGFP